MPSSSATGAWHVGRRTALIVIVCGLLVRCLVLAATTDLPPRIYDEKDYQALAISLLAGTGFSIHEGHPTSIRPPLYPAVIALVWGATGNTNPQVIRVVQIVLSGAMCALVYLIGRKVFDETTGTVAALLCWVYPTLVAFDFLLLTEILFTTLLMAAVLLSVILLRQPSWRSALALGIVLALGALCRSVLWPFPVLLLALLFVGFDVRWSQRVRLAGLVLLTYACVLAPWAVRNTRVQHTFVPVDVLGGFNLRMGNYEYTLEDRMWDTVALTGERSWSWELTQERPGVKLTEGEKEQWARRKAVEYMLHHPWTTLRRSLIRFGDFWGLEREIIAGFQQGLFRPPSWFAWLTTIAITGSYIVLVISAVAGAWLTRPRDTFMHWVLVLPVFFITAVHTIVFGHSRYHLPLVPLLCLFAASAAVRGTGGDSSRWRRLGAVATLAVLLAAWIRQLAVVDSARLWQLWERLL